MLVLCEYERILNESFLKRLRGFSSKVPSLPLLHHTLSNLAHLVTLLQPMNQSLFQLVETPTTTSCERGERQLTS